MEALVGVVAVNCHSASDPGRWECGRARGQGDGDGGWVGGVSLFFLSCL